MPKLQPPIAFWPDWRPCPYLPLTTGDSYISGLTAYCKSGCISGWVTHSNPSVAIGSLKGVPIHFPL